MIAGLLAMVAANLAAAGGAWSLSRRFRTGRPALDALVFLLLRLLLVSAAVLAFGWTGGLRPLPLALASLAALGLLGAAGELRNLPRLRGLPLSWPWKVLLGLVVVRLSLQAWIFSPYIGDTVAYHLPKVAEWVQAGRITLQVGPDVRGWFPAGFEIVEIWWTVFLRHDVIIEAAGVEFLLLGAAAAAALAEALGGDASFNLKAGLLYALTPGFHLMATSALNDGAAAAMVVALFALAAHRAPWPWLGLAAALATGIKPTAAFALPGVVLVYWLTRRPPPPADDRPLLEKSLLALALLVGGSWYLRNAIVFGNPIYPMGGQGILGPDGHVAQQTGFSLSSLGQNLADLAGRRLLDVGPLGALLPSLAGWGALAVSLGGVGLLREARTDVALRRATAGFLLSLLVVLGMVIPDPWCLRFVIFFPALPCIAALRLVDRVPVLRGLLAAAVLVQFLGTVVPGEFEVGAVRERLEMPWARRASRMTPHDPWSSDGIAIGPAANRTYAMYRPDYSRRVLHVADRDAEGLVKAMRAAGIRDLHASPSAPEVKTAVERRWLVQEPGNFYRLRN